MRFRQLGVGAAIGTVALTSALSMGSSAYAATAGTAARATGGGAVADFCVPTFTTSGVGSQGTLWTFKATYDFGSPDPVDVREQFQIRTAAAGQVWHVQLADNGVVFFDKVLTSTANGISVIDVTPLHGTGNQVLSVNATNLGNGETISGQVTLPPPPAASCTPH